MKVLNGKRMVKRQRKSYGNFTQYFSLTPQTTDLRYVIIMIHRGTSLLTSADKEAENIEEPRIQRGFPLDWSTKAEKACSIS
jgi:hypothetical protein